MRPSQTRFVAVCQQVLVLGVVLAVVTPAADVVSLEVVAPIPGGGLNPAAGASAASRAPGPRSAPGPDRALVPDAVVTPSVDEVPLTPSAGTATHGRRTPAGGERVLAAPRAVSGYGTLGVTWSRGAEVAEDALTVRVRTRTGADWSGWSALPYHADHGPDPGTAEARRARPGTEPVVVGRVDAVQVQAVSSSGPVPAGLTLAVVTPGRAAAARVQAPELDPAARAVDRGVVTARPRIYSRRQWGADERLRSGSPSYFEVHAGFVHHTVNANAYAAAEVPGILRSIYAYHTRSLGWSDIGYNFLVDRFGRIWEGRAGGVDRPVVGAHTSGYNDDAFAMSAIGNFETARPSAAILRAYGRLLAWKLSLHGVDAAATRQQVGGRTFAAINGHRDAGATACPGRYLYAELADIRRLAAGHQRGWSGRVRDTDLLSTGYPDLVLRRARDGAAYVLPTEGLVRFRLPRPVGREGWAGKDVLVTMPDATGDGRPDLFARDRASGVARVHPGTGTGDFGAGVRATSAFAGLEQVTSAGDLDEDGRPDLVGREPSTGRLLLFAGRSGGRFVRRAWLAPWAAYDRTVGVADFDRDGHRDLLARDTSGRLWLHPGLGTGRLAARVRLPGSWGRFDVLTGYGDYDLDGRPDLFARSARTGHGYVFPNRDGRSFRHWKGPLLAPTGLGRLSSPGHFVGGAGPDLLGRRGGRLVVVPHAGTRNVGPLRDAGMTLPGARNLLTVGDWDGDGDGDVVVRTTGGELVLRASDGRGRFAAPRVLARGFGRVGLLAAAGDLTGDGRPDLVGQPAGGSMRIYPGRGLRGLAESYVAHSALGARRQVGVGLWTGDGAPDLLLRNGDRLVLRPSNGPGGLMDARPIAGDASRYDWVLGVGQLAGLGHPDLVVRERRTGILWVLPGRPGGFGPRIFLRAGMRGFDLAG